jgi:hypothetical protein
MSAAAWPRFAPWPPTRWFSLSPREAQFSRRGFVLGRPLQGRFETIGQHFIRGFNVALSEADLSRIVNACTQVPEELRGFFVEGASMGCAVRDAFNWRGNCLLEWRQRCHSRFDYLVHVGAGWAAARLPWRTKAIRDVLDPVHHWLLQDGMGFHDAYFATRRVTSGWKRVRRGYQSRAYDQGVGRGLWFICAGDIAGVSELIANLPNERRADLWSGVGLAMAYAGEVSREDWAKGIVLAGSNAPWLRQGAAFATAARVLSQHVPEFTQVASLAACHADALTTADTVQRCRPDRRSRTSTVCLYEDWRRSVCERIGGNA